MKKNNLFLSKIKHKAFILKNNYQIPNCLYFRILNLKVDELDKVRILSEITEHMLRVKGYYKKYPHMNLTCEQELIKLGL